jgi:hypothetical protein
MCVVNKMCLDAIHRYQFQGSVSWGSEEFFSFVHSSSYISEA